MTQLGELQGHLDAFRERHARLVAISVEPVERARSVVARLGLGFPVLADPELAAARGFGVEDVENGIAWPAVFVVGTDGRVRWRSLSDDVAHRPPSSAILAVLDGAG